MPTRRCKRDQNMALKEIEPTPMGEPSGEVRGPRVRKGGRGSKSGQASENYMG